MLLRGRGDVWRALASGRDEALRDVADFSGERFVVTDFRILRLEGERLVLEDRFDGDARPTSCLKLLVGADGLFSMGPKDLYVFRDGRWRSMI